MVVSWKSLKDMILPRMLERSALAHDLGRRGQTAGNRRSRRDIGVGQIDLARRVTHPPAEVAVAGGDATLAGGQDAHMPAEAWATGGRAHGAIGLDEDLHQPFAYRVQVNLLAAGDDDGSNSWVDLPAAEHGRRCAQILQVAVGAHADH